ncbi:hypothetical protein, conserved [Angomonas deanei]|uniref:Uncharacterized protein n=1 Tax=Angomonas deanei TaxID=59799 RepID=A0A7G2CC58_9TRYP|nr:hypothetical protein, conserved [Angomonas deanei]
MGSEEALNRGVQVMGINFSIRLFLNYMMANLLTFPLYTYQLRFCLAIRPYAKRVFSPFSKTKRTTSTIPKAPSPSS